MDLFELNEECASYKGQQVLDRVSLQIKAGEKIALVGQSGAGKSTLLRLLFNNRKDECAFVPQDLGLVNNLSVFHNTFIGRLHKNSTFYNLANLIRPFTDEQSAVLSILSELQLSDKIFSPVGELSGGQQQRTGIARALYQKCEIFLGDEPVSAVDEHQARKIMGVIIQNHKTVVLAMHDVQLALRFCDRIVGLSSGRIVLDRKSADMSSSDFDGIYGN